MLKKSLPLLLATLLAACSSTPDPTANAKYKISDKDMLTLIEQGNALEQCVYPELKGMTLEQAKSAVYDKMSEAEKIVWSHTSAFLMGDVLGENALTLFDDPPSLAYYQQRFQALNNMNAAHLPQDICEQRIKPEFKRLLIQAQKIAD